MLLARFGPQVQLDARTTMYPSQLTTYTGEKSAFESQTSTYFGFCLRGELSIERRNLPVVKLAAGMFFSLPGDFVLSGAGEAMVIERVGYRGLVNFGGPVEDDGRLCYIDGCKCTILVAPARLGDPVFNLLVFPPGVAQSIHVHPTIRLGCVYRGSGESHTKEGQQALRPGDLFLLREGEQHCFHTQGEGMTVIAFHPDSDVGPTDSSHPMLSRTFTKF